MFLAWMKRDRGVRGQNPIKVGLLDKVGYAMVAGFEHTSTLCLKCYRRTKTWQNCFRFKTAQFIYELKDQFQLGEPLKSLSSLPGHLRPGQRCPGLALPVSSKGDLTSPLQTLPLTCRSHSRVPPAQTDCQKPAGSWCSLGSGGATSAGGSWGSCWGSEDCGCSHSLPRWWSLPFGTSLWGDCSLLVVTTCRN